MDTSQKHINKVCLAGLLTEDPVTRSTTTGKRLTSATLCCASTAKNKTFLRIVAWETQAEELAKHKKGAYLEVHGRLQCRSYEAGGSRKTITEVVITEFGNAADRRATGPDKDPSSAVKKTQEDGKYCVPYF